MICSSFCVVGGTPSAVGSREMVRETQTMQKGPAHHPAEFRLWRQQDGTNPIYRGEPGALPLHRLSGAFVQSLCHGAHGPGRKTEPARSQADRDGVLQPASKQKHLRRSGWIIAVSLRHLPCLAGERIAGLPLLHQRRREVGLVEYCPRAVAGFDLLVEGFLAAIPQQIVQLVRGDGFAVGL